MKSSKLECANCGAPIDVGRRAREVVCPYCETQLMIRQAESSKTPKPEWEQGETPTDAQAPPVQRRFTEVADVVRSGAQIVDKVSGVLWWTKAAILGGLVIIVLGCVGIPSLFVYRLFSNNDSVQKTISTTSDNLREFVDGERSETRASRAAMKEGIQHIESEVRSQGRKPDAERGAALIHSIADGWQRPMRFEPLEGDDYAIRSGGPDGQFDTADDVVETRSISKILEYANVPAPADFDEARAYMATLGYSRTKAAIHWLADADPDSFSSEQRHDVVAKLIRAVSLPRMADLARKPLLMWSRPEDGIKIRDALCVSNRDEAAATFSAVLVKNEAGQLLLDCINHRNSSIRDEVRRHVSSMNLAPENIIYQCIEDLADDQKWHVALQYLGTQKVRNEARDEVAQRLRPFVANARVATRGDQLMAFIKQLGEHEVSLLADSLGSIHTRAPDRLVEIGSEAEPELIRVLLNGPLTARRNAAGVLGILGTEQSLKPLETVRDQSPEMRGYATKAIDAIRSRLNP